MREKEELRLVRSASELRVGMLVVNSPCINGHSHRFMLTDSRMEWGDVEFRIAPSVDCGRARLDCFVPSLGIARGSVFIVDTGLENDTTTDTAVPTRKPVLVSR